MVTIVENNPPLIADAAKSVNMSSNLTVMNDLKLGSVCQLRPYVLSGSALAGKNEHATHDLG